MTTKTAFYIIIYVVENLDILETKLNILIKKFVSLKEENEQLKIQVKFLKEEEIQHKSRLSQNYLLNQKQKKAILKLEKILKKIDSCGSLNG